MYKRKPAFGIAWICLFLLPVLLSGQATSAFKPSGKVHGLAFVDFYWKAAGDTATWASRAEYSGVPEDVYAFAIRRMYLGYDYNISPTFSTTALLEGGDGFLTSRGDRSVTIKALNLRWKEIYPGADLLIGQIPALAFSYVSEKVWGYRSVEKTIVDQRGIRSSSDLGISLLGKFDTLSNYGYSIMIANGTSTRPEELTPAGKHKIFSGELYAYLFDRRLIFDLYGDFQTGLNERNVSTVKGFAGYQTDPFTLGVEVFMQNQHRAKSDGADLSPFGVSVFARGVLIKDKVAAFARWDSYSPDGDYRTDRDPLQVYNASSMHRHYDETFFLAGLDITPHSNVHIIPNIWINSYTPKAENQVLVDRKADIVPRVTFYFVYK